MATLLQETDVSVTQGKNPNEAYECCVHVCPDATSGFYAYAVNLPGVVSEGDTEQEAIEGIKDAFRGVVQTYRESGESIPWTDCADPLPDGAVEKRIIVNV